MPTVFVLTSILIFMISTRWVEAQQAAPLKSPPRLLSWAAIIEKARHSPSLGKTRRTLVENARRQARLGPIRRPLRLSEIGQDRSVLDGRSHCLEAEIKEAFALAMADVAACKTLADELPLLAAAYRLTEDQALLDRLVAQLEEMADWSPLQRPGWSLQAPGLRLPPEGQDGQCLATGCGVRALADSLEILPKDSLPLKLYRKLEILLEKEIAAVVNDWETKRPWFVRNNNPLTHQWVLPTEGLIRACLTLNREKHQDAYEMGVRNLLKALDAQGEAGEHVEGYGWALFSVSAMLQTARAMAQQGDNRALDHPFIQHFPTWLVHHFQPGKMIINCFNAGKAYDAAQEARPLLSLLACCTENETAQWALKHFFPSKTSDLPGLASRTLHARQALTPPPCFAAYKRATRLNWRSSWDEQATGLWLRGGHLFDQHDHQDRGHINFIAQGKPILIEAGTPNADHPLMMTHFTTGVGHNVLQLGEALPREQADPGELIWYPGWQKRGGVAPISVEYLNQAGGSALVDGSTCYDGLSRWKRNLVWSERHLAVVDDVVLQPMKEQVILFRWHLGAQEEVDIIPMQEGAVVNWKDAEILFQANAAIQVTQVRLPDNTLAGHNGEDRAENSHICLVLQSQKPIHELYLETKVRAH